MEAIENFDAFERLAAGKLEAEGYQIMVGEAQAWAARYSLTHANLGGSATLFFGPFVEKSDGQWCLPYRVVMEHSADGHLDIVHRMSIDQMATAFVTHLERIFHDVLHPRHEMHPNVGAGLISVTTADAKLDTIWQSEAGEASLR